MKSLWQAWTFIIFLIIVIIHSIVYCSVYNFSDKDYKLISLITQIVGGLLILYSINGNIKIVKKITLMTMLTGYFKKNQDAIAAPKGVGVSIFGGNVKVIVIENPESVEEKIENLRKQIDDLKVNFIQKATDLNERLTQQSEELNSQINQVSSERKELTAQIEEIFSSWYGIHIQVFGVLLMIYGAVMGAIPDVFLH